MKKNKKSALLILDGWGTSPNESVSALAQAKTPYYKELISTYPNATLLTDGLNVGLPEGQMGNSEVGHMNIGAGRIVFQDLVKINKSIEDRSFFELPILVKALKKAEVTKQTVHIVGLVSYGGVHSHIDHLKALIQMIKGYEIGSSYLHAITDGRDTDPKSGIENIREIDAYIKESPIKIASVIGRYFAMDRDKRWERIKKAYDLYCNGKGELTNDILVTIQNSYNKGVTDEFLEPIICSKDKEALIKDGDLVIFFNYRADRPRELTEVLSQTAFEDFGMSPKTLDFITYTEYNKNYKNIKVLFEKEKPQNTIGEYLSNLGKTQLRIAETEKYAHVTFFFNGGLEREFLGENRILVPSPKVATYDLKPEMSAAEITTKVTENIINDTPDFICLNYANADMVGHTGDFEASKSAAVTIDNNLKKLIPILLQYDYEVIIIADHGNSDHMINEDGSANTQHSLNPVPLIYISNDNQYRKINAGILADVAPTILYLMGIEVPKEMTGKILI